MKKKIQKAIILFMEKMGKKYSIQELCQKGNIYDFSTITLEDK